MPKHSTERPFTALKQIATTKERLRLCWMSIWKWSTVMCSTIVPIQIAYTRQRHLRPWKVMLFADTTWMGASNVHIRTATSALWPSRVWQTMRRTIWESRQIPVTFLTAARQKNRLIRHMKIHSEVRSFPCTVKRCSFRAKTEDVLRGHKVTHNKEVTLPCTIPGCAYLAWNKNMLKAHIRRHECPNLKACPQPGCTYIGNSLKSLRLHQQLHDDRGRPFACPLCPKFFASKKSLDVHSFSHTKERSIKCVHCDYGAYLPRSLIQHYQKFHPAENFNSDWLRPMVITCEYCGLSGTGNAIF